MPASFACLQRSKTDRSLQALMVTQFYAPRSAFRDGYVTLPEDEARHAAQVLRVSAGDRIEVVDGEGCWHLVQLDAAGRDHVAGRVLEEETGRGEPAYQLTLGLGLIKQRSRWETALEKATELGVHTIVPLLTERGEKAGMRRDRCERILLAAMKQCGRCRLPELRDPATVEEAVTDVAAPTRFIAWMDANREQSLSNALAKQPSDELCIWVGPEAGFSEREARLAQHHGFLPVSLGRRRLRAETAAILVAAACTLHIQN